VDAVDDGSKGETMTRGFAWMMAALLAAGCTAAPTPAPTVSSVVSLNVGNGTTLDVTIVVNGQTVGVFPSRVAGPTIDTSKLPPLPWTVEARTSSGRVLATMTVHPGDGVEVFENGVGKITIPMGQVDLSCGRLTIWAGDHGPSGPVPPSPAGSPGDCLP
jgi:hypothetical protein